ncbi:MAG: MoxR family ATPase [Dissulfurispiraceae bacterium]|jgi:MoxR-like ATPase|nr:MoxR family ATPase [Dissulfurispiraceae bacterium]
MLAVKRKIDSILESLSGYLHGKDAALRLALITFFSRGHLLIEDMPGLGKTTLAIGIAKSLDLSFGRIQCTSDLLPTDITGLSIFDKTSGEFVFHPGPIFNNIVLIDEINRTTPKTQSALIEAMGEKQVTVDRQTYKLPKPFFVIATQNPVEQFGTFYLPESQLDRFLMKISIGYPARDAEMEILRKGSRRGDLYTIAPVMDGKEVMQIQDMISASVHMSEKIIEYIMNIVEATRVEKRLVSGLSTRGALAMQHTAKANAFLKGRDYVIPEDIKELSGFVIPHRIIFREEYEHTERQEMVRSLIESVKAPV